jgi:hypothetical protein
MRLDSGESRFSGTHFAIMRGGFVGSNSHRLIDPLPVSSRVQTIAPQDVADRIGDHGSHCRDGLLPAALRGHIGIVNKDGLDFRH